MKPNARLMALALDEARRARGATSPNPAVGAVVVAGGAVVGRGHTQPPGGPHAEVMALHEAGERARGATLYVTLEPCSAWGRTPPCVDAVLGAGIATVHCAMTDPDVRVRGRGLARLAAAGVHTTVGTAAARRRGSSRISSSTASTAGRWWWRSSLPASTAASPR
ncbi:MAG: bifunctional diaminohydroxyphosphoribosylaminopyrimidine deaminase/5-amino-6-(5-phosphoribosylamino)uracil reductase RibD [Dehalococcoidia bacterium]